MNAHAKYRVEPAEQVRARRVREQAVLQYMLFQQVATEPPIVNKDELEASIQDYVVSLSRQQVIDKLLEVPAELPKANSYGMNWKMTAKTILVQLHHIDLTSRHSTTAVGIERVLGLRHDAELSEDELTARIRAKISDTTLLTI